MKFIRNLIEKLEEIEPIDVVFTCVLIALVVTTAVLVVCGAATIFCLVCKIVTAVAGAF